MVAFFFGSHVFGHLEFLQVDRVFNRVIEIHPLLPFFRIRPKKLAVVFSKKCFCTLYDKETRHENRDGEADWLGYVVRKRCRKEDKHHRCERRTKEGSSDRIVMFREPCEKDAFYE